MNSRKPLEPRLEPLALQVIQQANELSTLVDMLGSPLNIILPELIPSKIEGFRNVFNELSISGQVFFAHKSNKSLALLSELACNNCCIDVASVNELRDALGRGIPSSRIEATGPKSIDFLALCVSHGILINADSIEELQLASIIAFRMGLTDQVPALLRLAEFRPPEIPTVAKRSKFGIRADTLLDALEKLRKLENIFLKGFSFHLDTPEENDRALAIEECLCCMDIASAKGFDINILNIGGGFSVNLVANENEWREYFSDLISAVVGEKQPMSWNNYSFGACIAGGKLLNRMNIFAIAVASHGATQLKQLLMRSSSRFGGAALGTVIADCGYQVYIEPGKALVATSGMTIGRVLGIKTSNDQTPLIMMEMNETNLSLSLIELFLDPLLVSDDKLIIFDDNRSGVEVYLGGNLCLERDMVSRRRCLLPRLPKRGDLLIFANTGAYSMDFCEALPLKQSIAKKVAAFSTTSGIRFVSDDQYSPFMDLRKDLLC